MTAILVLVVTILHAMFPKMFPWIGKKITRIKKYHWIIFFLVCLNLSEAIVILMQKGGVP